MQHCLTRLVLHSERQHRHCWVGNIFTGSWVEKTGYTIPNQLYNHALAVRVTIVTAWYDCQDVLVCKYTCCLGTNQWSQAVVLKTLTTRLRIRVWHASQATFITSFPSFYKQPGTITPWNKNITILCCLGLWDEIFSLFSWLMITHHTLLDTVNVLTPQHHDLECLMSCMIMWTQLNECHVRKTTEPLMLSCSSSHIRTHADVSCWTGNGSESHCRNTELIA